MFRFLFQKRTTKELVQTTSSVDLSYINLEARQVLNADFDFDGFSLDLQNFSNSDPSNNTDNVVASSTGSNYFFALSEGVWSGTDSSGGSGAALSGLGTGLLTISDTGNDLGSVLFDNSDDFGIEFGDFNFGGDLTIDDSAGTSPFSEVTQTLGSQLSLAGDFDVSGVDSIMLGNIDNDFNAVSIDNADEVVLHDTNGIQLNDISILSTSGSLDVSTSNGGDITQLSGASLEVAGLANFDADGSGNVLLNEGNDFQNSVSATGSTVEIRDINDLDVSNITAVDDILLESGFGDGDTDSNGLIDGMEIAQTGGISLGDLTTTDANGQIFLQTDDFINDGSTGVITTTDLLIRTNLESTSNGIFGSVGSFIQLVDSNQVDRIAVSSDLASNISGGSFEFQFSNSQDLEIANLTYTSVSNAPVSISGFGVQDDVRLRIVGDLTQQAGAAVVVTGDFGLTSLGTAAENVLLTDANNDFNRIAINSSGTGGAVSENVEIVDRDDINVVEIANSGTRISQVMITAGAGGTGAIDIAGDIDANTVLLQGADGVDQTGGGIVADLLMLGGDDALESSGDFILTSVTNNVEAVAANLQGDLELSNAQDLSIVKADFEALADTDSIIDEDFVGVVLAGNLTLSIVGSALQSTGASTLPGGVLRVGGNTEITATEDICLLGVDCDGDGIEDNSFGGDVELLAGGDIAFATSGTLVIDNDFSSGSGSLRFIADDIAINADIIANQLLLEANNGVSQDDAFFIDVTDLLLSGSGNFDLATNASNVIDNLAAEIDGNLELTNSVDLSIGSLTFTSDCGEVSIKGVSVTVDASITTSSGSSIAQASDAAFIVGAHTTLDVGNGDICLAAGDCDGDGNTNNDFNTLEIVSAANAEVLDANALTVTSSAVTGQLWLAAGAADGTPGDGVSGALTLDGNLTAGSQALLQASEGAVQTNGVITTNQLLLGGDAANESSGNFVLNQANQVDQLSASLLDSLEFTNAQDLTIVKATYTSVCDSSMTESLSGVGIGNDLTLQVTGLLEQTNGWIVVGDQATFSATGNIWLVGADCDDDGVIETFNDFNTLEIQIAMSAEVVDANDLTVMSATVTDQLWLAAGAADGTAGDGVSGALTLDGNLTAGNQILLQASEGVVQASGFITTNQLMLGGDTAIESTGDFDLNQANQVNQLSASLIDSLEFTNALDLRIVQATYTSVFDSATTESLNGVGVDGDLTLQVAGLLDQTSGSVGVGGATTLSATGNIWLVGADSDNDGVIETFNEFNTLEIVSATSAEVIDADDLTVTSATVTDQLWLAAGAADAIPDNGVNGSLTLDGNLTASNQILLQASEGAMQTNGVITTSQLLLGGDASNESNGNFSLNQANQVDQLSANLIESLELTNALDLTIVQANFTSVCDSLITESLDGIGIGDDLTLQVTGLLEQSNGLIVVGDLTTLSATGNIWLVGADGDDDGVIETLNEFNTLEIVSATSAEVVDANDLTVMSATVTDQLWLAAGAADGTPGDGVSGALTLDGNLTAGNKILLQASEGAVQTNGVITANQLLLGGDAANESSGNFSFNQANQVNQLAASLVDSLEFTNAQDLRIVEATYTSVCDSSITESVNGVVIGGDLTLQVTGLLDQASGSVDVEGATTLAATGNIWLVGADGDNDGVIETFNEFNTLEIVSATSAEVIDADDLTVTSATVTDQLWLAAGATDGTPGDGVSGALTLDGNLTAGNQILLQASEGAVQTNGVITTNQLLLGGDDANESSGDFVLNQSNQVDQLSASLLDSLELTNALDLTIVKAIYTGVCDSSMTESLSGVGIGDDLTLQVAGLLEQTSGLIVVGDLTTLSATSNILLVGADCDDDGVIETFNDFNTLEIVSASSAEVRDANDLTVTSATVTDQLWLAAGAADGTPGDGVSGALTLDGNLTAGNQILLQASEGAAQTNGVITTNQLLLGGDAANESSGDFNFNQANQVNGISANLLDNLELNNLGDLSIIKGNFLSVGDPSDGESFVGVRVDRNLILTVEGSVLQNTPDSLLPAGAVIIGGDLDILATEDICLLGVDCDGDGLQDNSFGGDLNLSAGGEIALVTSGSLVIDSGLVSGGGSLRFIADDITISTDIVADQLLLQANNSVSLDDVFFVDVTDLLLSGAGDFDLVTAASNVIDNIATEIVGDLSLTNSVDLNIGNATFEAACGDVSICGVTVDGNLSFELVDSNLSQTAAIVVTGSTRLGIVDGVDPNAIGDGTICLTGADCDGDGVNDNDFGGAVKASATTVELVDSNGLIVGDISAVDNIFLRAGDGATGTLTINGDLVTSQTTGQVLLQSDLGITQDAIDSVITTNDLLVGSDTVTDARTGDVILSGQNQVNNLAAALDASLTMTNVQDLNIGSVTYDSACGTSEAICGVNLQAGGDLTLTLVDSSLDQTAAVVVTGDTLLDAGTGSIWLIGADCDSDGNLDGLNDNDFVGTVTASASSVELVDSNDLVVGDIIAVDDIRLESGDGDGDSNGNGVIDAGETRQSGNLVIDGDLTTADANGQILLQSDSGIVQQVNQVITSNDLLIQSTNEATALSTISAAGSSERSFDLRGLNQVNRISVDIGFDGQNLEDATELATDQFGDNALQFRNGTDLEVAELKYDSALGTMETIGGVNIDGDMNLTFVDASLRQTAAVLITGNTRMEILDGVDPNTSIDGTIWLTGADGDGDGTNDNDFVGTVTAIAPAIEIADNNDLGIIDAIAEDSIFLRAGDGQAGVLTLERTITTTAIDGSGELTGQVLLQSDLGITQDAVDSVITTNDLLIGSDTITDVRTSEVVLGGQNQVNNLAAALDASLTMTNARDLNIGSFTFDSACGTSEAICGVNLQAGSDLTLMLVDASLDQTAAVIVTGTTDISIVSAVNPLQIGVGTICLTGADCDGDGLNDNDFVGSVTASATTVELVDSNGLVVGDISAVDNIFLRAGDGASGTLTVDGDLTTSETTGQVLLQSDLGITQNAVDSVITANDLLIGSDITSDVRAGDVILSGQNQVNNLALSIDSDFRFNNSADLKLAAISYSSACGTTESQAGLDANNIGLAVDGNLTFEQRANALNTLFLDVTGDLTQIAAGTIEAGVDKDGTISAESLAIQIDGNTVLNNAGNDVGVFAAITDGAVHFTDADNLKVGTVLVQESDVNQPQISINGITTSDADVKLTTLSADSTDNNLTLEEQVALGAGDLFLDVTAGDVTQIAAGDISAAGLALQVSGNTVLNNAGNDVDVLSVNTDGAVHYTDADNLKVSNVTAETVVANGAMADVTEAVASDEMSIVGLTTTDADVKLTTLSADSTDNNLTLEEQVALGAGDLFLDVTDGDLSQIAMGDISAAGLALQVSGNTVLNNAGNDVDVLSVTTDGAVHYTDADNLKVGSVTAETVVANGAMADVIDAVVSDEMSIVGITTTDADVKLTTLSADSTDNNLTLEEQIALGDGDLFLNVTAGDVTQIAAGNISAAGLALQVSGNTVLNNADNDVDVLSVNTDGAVDYTDADNLRVGSVTAETVVANRAMADGDDVVVSDEMSVNGIMAVDNFTLTTDNGDFGQEPTAAIVVGGVTTLDVGTGDICLHFGDDDGDGNNDNDLNAIVIVSATDAEIVDRNDLTVNAANVSDQLQLQAGNVDLGNLTLAGNIDAGSQVLLQASNDATQSGGVISSPELLVSGANNFNLFDTNLIGSESTLGLVSVDVMGDFAFQNLFGIELNNLSFLTKDGSSIANTTFDVGGDLTLFSEQSGLAISDEVDINVAGDAWLLASVDGGAIATDQLNVIGAIGFETTNGDALLVNNSGSGFIVRGDEQPGVASSAANFHFENNSVNGTLTIQATNGDISNEDDTSLTVSETLRLTAGTANATTLSGSNNEFDILLGDRLNDQFDVETIEINSLRASVQLDADVVVSNSFVGEFTGDNLENGNLVLSNTGSIIQANGAQLVSNQAGFASEAFVFLDDLTANRLAVSALGDVDVSSFENVPEAIPSDEADEFAPRFNDIDTGYGIVVVNQGDLVVGSVSDPLGAQATLQGFLSDSGHIFIQSNSTPTEAGDILFTGNDAVNGVNSNGVAFGVVGNVNNGHAITTIAAGDLNIDPNSILVSSTGAVTDISPFTTPEGVNSTTVTLEGPFMQLFPPTADNNPTTRTIGSNNTQFIGLDIGRAGEQRFLVEVDFADGVTEIFEFASDVGERFEVVSRTFDSDFLFSVLELPTELTVFNDPGINLFDANGNGDLNSSATDLNTSDNSLIAFSQSRPQGDLTLRGVEVRESVVIERTPVLVEPTITTPVDDFEFEEEFIAEEVTDSKAELFFVGDDEEEVKIRLISENETITPDVVSQWRDKVESGIEFPPGKYRLKWTDNGVPFAIDFTKFVDENIEELDDESSEIENDPDETTDPELEGPAVDPLDNLDSEGDSSPSAEAENGGLGIIEIEPEKPAPFNGAQFSLATSVVALALSRAGKGSSLRGSLTQARTTENDSCPEISFSKLARSKRRIKKNN